VVLVCRLHVTFIFEERQMKRRAFLSLFGGAVAAWPVRARAAAGKRPTVGFLVPGTQASYAQWLSGFVQRMRELGWRDSDNVEIIYRATEGVQERYAEIAAEFVKLKVDVIVATGSEGVVAAKQATSAIPIVFAATADPVAIGLVESLAHPGGNVTGLSAESTDFAGKEVELLRELVPGLQRLPILTNPDSPGMNGRDRQSKAAARAAGLEVVTLAVRRAEEITAAFDGLKNKADAIYCVPGPLTGTNRVRICYLGARSEAAGDLRPPELCRRRRPYVLWAGHRRSVPARRRFCRQDTPRREAGRYPRRATDQTLALHQPDHRQGTRS
jgi:ABC-type uncharacterized transport system substrate-binding protein